MYLLKVASQPRHILIQLNAVTWGERAVHFYASGFESK